jgi:hypothetical protein
MNEYYPRNGFPKLVHMGFGIIATARNQEDLDRMRRGNLLSVLISVPLSVVLVGLIVWAAQ